MNRPSIPAGALQICAPTTACAMIEPCCLRRLALVSRATDAAAAAAAAAALCTWTLRRALAQAARAGNQKHVKSGYRQTLLPFCLSFAEANCPKPLSSDAWSTLRSQASGLP